MPGPLSDPGFVVEEHRFEELDWPDSRAPSPGAAEERPVAQHRRGRDELEANDRENLVQGPSKKQRLGVANEVSNSLGLEDHEREEVKRLSQLDPHSIAIWQCGLLLALGRQQADNECEIYLQGEYKGHATRKLQAIMMEPTLPSYVGNLTSRVVRYMQQHPGSFGIPDSLVSVPGSGIWSRRFSRAVGRTFTVFRSETLKKVSLSLVPGAAKRDIAALAKYIAPANFITGKSHWTRVAFIRAYVVAWLADGKPKPFWKYLDEKRDKLAERDDPTAFLTQVFKKDQETYPAPRLKGKRGIHGAGILPQRMAMPVWQRGTKEIVETIENYEPDELDPKIPVDDVHDEEVNGGDEGPGDEQPGDEDEDGEGNKGGEDNEGGEGGNKAGEKENE